jgi:flagellar protein FlaG
MNVPPPNSPQVNVSHTADYREGYSNSVQIRLSLWDFFLMFGTATQNSPDAVHLNVFQGVYLSPQQAKALAALLQQNIAHYEQAFGEIRLEAQGLGSGVVQ